jgi:stage II sporulation SpoAA-like protein
MIEIIKELPDSVVGIVATGRVTNEECNNVLRPAIEASLRRHGKIRLYYEIGSRFPGAGWDNLDIGIDNPRQLERIAVVTDTGWVRQTVNALRFLIASEVRVFTRLDAEEGRAWITSSSAGSCEQALVGPITSPVRGLRRLPRASLPRSRRPSARQAQQGDRRYRHPSAGGR